MSFDMKIDIQSINDAHYLIYIKIYLNIAIIYK